MIKKKKFTLGITSTYVENTAFRISMAPLTWDHLHIRGEYAPLIVKLIVLSGSPPHTWRIPNNNIAFVKVIGITSTYVENTPPYLINYKIARDHLHIRGEYQVVNEVLDCELGSPPHTWRIPDNWERGRKANRITSTYVENTFG